MKTCVTALAGTALVLGAAGSATAHTAIRVHVGVPTPYSPYYPPLVQVQPRYVAVPVYQQYQQYQHTSNTRKIRKIRKCWSNRAGTSGANGVVTTGMTAIGAIAAAIIGTIGTTDPNAGPAVGHRCCLFRKMANSSLFAGLAGPAWRTVQP